MKKEDRYLSVIKFAELAGVNRSAIYQKLDNGELVRLPNGKLDVTDPTNKLYIETDRSRAGNGKGKGGTVIIPPVVPELSDLEKSIDMAITSKAGASLLKEIENVKKLRIHNEKQLENLIDRGVVRKYFGAMSSIIINYFFPIGNRLAPRVAGVCKVTDPADVIKIQTIIDKEIMRALEQFKKECEGISENER